MRFNFGQLIDEVLLQSGKTLDELDDGDSTLNSIKRRINMIVNSVTASAAFNFRKARFYFSTLAPVEDGTISVTKGSRSVTGTGTTFTDIAKFGYLIVAIFNINIIKLFMSTIVNFICLRISL